MLVNDPAAVDWLEYVEFPRRQWEHAHDEVRYARRVDRPAALAHAEASRRAYLESLEKDAARRPLRHP